MTENNVRHRKQVSNHTHILNTSSSNDTDNDSSFTLINKQQQQQRSTYIRNKTEGLTCCICRGLARGYNFDVITCESCKAFFRRNALKADGIFKCRINNGRCVMTISTRKRCKACRLAKCFEKGMRADWILTEEERVNKRQKIEENRRLRQMIYPDSSETDMMQSVESYDDDVNNTIVSSSSSSPISLLSSEDLIKIQQIKEAYTDSVRLTSLSSQFPSYPESVRITETSDMINIFTNILVTRLITYFKLLPEFSSLNDHDKFILIKHNTFTLSYIRAALNYNPLTNTYHEPNTGECVFTGNDLIQCLSLHQYERSINCIRNLLDASLDDRFLLEVLLIIMVFSKGSSICTYIGEMEPVAHDTLSIYQAQNVFIDILWKYCENKFGLSATIKSWLKLTVYSMNAHLQAYNIRHDFMKIDSVADRLSPLMKSVLLII